MIQNELEVPIGAESLYATHYRADGTRFVVVVPPLFEEDARLRKVMVNLSRYLRDAGYDVLRFDYYGTAFSPGRYEDVTLERARQNLDDAIDYCRNNGGKRILSVGVRFGGYLALEALESATLDGVVAWEPVLNPALYIREVLRSEVATQMLIYGEVRRDRDRLIEALRSEGKLHVEGYLISKALYDQLTDGKAIETERLLADSRRFAFVYWQTKREQKKWSAAGIRSHWVDGVRFGYNHIRYMAPRSDELYRQTLEELKRDAQATGTV